MMYSTHAQKIKKKWQLRFAWLQDILEVFCNFYFLSQVFSKTTVNLFKISSLVYGYFFLVIFGHILSVVPSVQGQETDYRFEILAQTGKSLPGMGVISSLGKGPSINDNGSVVFKARDTNGTDAVFVGALGTLDSRGVRSGTFSFAEYVQINNMEQFVWREASNDGLVNSVKRLGLTETDFRIVARNRFLPLFPSPFDLTLPWASVNNNGRVVFSADRASVVPGTFLCTQRVVDGSGGFEQPEDFFCAEPLSGFPELFPMISDNDRVVVRGGGTDSAPLTVFTEPTFNIAQSFTLGSANGFDTIGEKPGISDDGRLAVFMGAGASVGAGIFGFDLDAESPTFFQIAGRPLSNSLSSVARSSRVGVNRFVVTNNNEYYTTFLAARSTGGPPEQDPFGIYVSRFGLNDPGQPAPAPINITTDLLIEVGELIPEFPELGRIKDFTLYDPINKRGEIVFWIQTDTGSQAIIRATQEEHDQYLIWMTGAGSASKKDIQNRKLKLEKATSDDTQVVVFSPSSRRGYTASDIQKILEFLDKLEQNGVPGTNLHFLASSAGAAPFENNIYKHLPEKIGSVFIVQPFCAPAFLSPLPTEPPCNTQTILTSMVKPEIYVIYDIKMNDEWKKKVGAGPSLFEDQSITQCTVGNNESCFWYIEFDHGCGEVDGLSKAFKFHGNSVGKSEDLAQEVLRLITRKESDITTPSRRLRSQLVNGGRGAPPPHKPEIWCGSKLFQNELFDGTAEQNETTGFSFSNLFNQDLNVILSWPGSTLGLRIIHPDGTLFFDQESDVSPIVAIIPDAQIGEWQFEVDGINTTNPSEPFEISVLAPDDDEDGVPNIGDNCPRIQNWNQVDDNEDGIGDACSTGGIVPDVIGQLLPTAISAIEGAELVDGSITEKSSDVVPTSHVISQEPLAGTQVDPGSSINLVVSLGPALDPSRMILELQKGWNLISLSKQPQNNNIKNIFGNRIAGPVWTWDSANQTFEVASTINATKGFWVYSRDNFLDDNAILINLP